VFSSFPAIWDRSPCLTTSHDRALASSRGSCCSNLSLWQAARETRRARNVAILPSAARVEMHAIHRDQPASVASSYAPAAVPRARAHCRTAAVLWAVPNPSSHAVLASPLRTAWAHAECSVGVHLPLASHFVQKEAQGRELPRPAVNAVHVAEQRCHRAAALFVDRSQGIVGLVCSSPVLRHWH
jgi:hypothetical protein